MNDLLLGILIGYVGCGLTVVGTTLFMHRHIMRMMRDLASVGEPEPEEHGPPTEGYSVTVPPGSWTTVETFDPVGT